MVNKIGYTPMHFAAERGNLLECLKQIERIKRNNFRRLGHQSIVENLLKYNADITLKAKDGNTSLTLARLNGHDWVVDILQSAKGLEKSERRTEG